MIDFFNRHSMYVFVLIGLLAGVPGVWKFRDRAKLGPPGVVLMCIAYSVCSVIAAMLFAQTEFLIRGQGFHNLGAISTYGIYFYGTVMILLLGKLAKLPAVGVMDLYALYAMPSFFMLRLHCLKSGCCGGSLIGGTGLYWPTREMELVFYLVMFVLLWRMLRKNELPGQLFPLLMAAYGVFRFIVQWLREDNNGFSLSHCWSVLCAVIGLSLFFELRAHAKEKKKPKEKPKR